MNSYQLIGENLRGTALILFFFVMIFSIQAYAWTEPVRISDDGILDPRAIVVGETLHVVGTGGTLNCYYLKSNDNGLTWTEPIIIANTLENSEGPDIIYSHNRIHIALIGYYEPTTIYHISSSDGGESWSSLHQVFNTGPFWLGDPTLAANGDTLFLTCAMENRILFFRSFDDGETWQDSTVVDSGTLAIIWPQTLIFTAGKLCLTEELWVGDNYLTYEIYCCTSNNYGLSWSERTPISTVERYPQIMFASQEPTAFADSFGHVCIAWMDYKYGYMCDFSGDILARSSTDGGESWFPESRLTQTQSGETPHGLFADGVNIVVIKDNYPLGCSYPKITLTKSTDQGNNWTPPEIISGDTQDSEMMPFLFQNTVAGEKIFHCVFFRNDLYYTRSSDYVSIEDSEKDIQLLRFNLRAYPNPFNSATTITLTGAERAEIGIYDITGRLITTLHAVGGQALWDASAYSSGLYFARLAGEKPSAIKLILLK